MSEASGKAAGAQETVARTLLVALLVSLVCSSFVASAAILLRPRQEENERLDRQRHILEVAGLLVAEADVDELFEQIDPRVIELPSGEEATIYVVESEGALESIILPVEGSGLWSTLYGFVALERDGNTVAGLTFYEQGETPGLGDQVAKPAWRSLWEGKKLFGPEGDLRIEVVKGPVAPNDPMADYRVDGISGATLTGNGVTNLLRHWLGEQGYGPFLNQLRSDRGER